MVRSLGCGLLLTLAVVGWSAGTIGAQEIIPDTTQQSAATDDPEAVQPVEVAKEVQVDPVNSDERIEARLQEIMDATGWFADADVRVDRGVVFLSGSTDTLEHQQWAEATVMNTSDVVAVVNRITVREQPMWNIAPAIASLKELGRETTAMIPLILIAIVVAVIAYFLAIAAAHLTRWLTHKRLDSQLLCQVAGNVAAVLVFIIGIYVALRVSGLTRLAVTLLGGTGLVGLALGFAFRDIAENYLASILISLNHPFRVGDLIEVEGAKGFVRKVTTRGTILNTLEGNQIQLPNSTVYKGMITNHTASPLSRREFRVGIGFDDSITQAQTILMEVMKEHQAVVDDPAPMVVVDSLGSATVNLLIMFWFDQTKHSPLKVRSSVIRMAKQRLTDAKITMPDEARELVFPQGVPVQLIRPPRTSAGDDQVQSPDRPAGGSPLDRGERSGPTAGTESQINAGEGDLSNDQNDVMRATKDDQTLQDEANLIG